MPLTLVQPARCSSGRTLMGRACHLGARSRTVRPRPPPREVRTRAGLCRLRWCTAAAAMRRRRGVCAQGRRRGRAFQVYGRCQIRVRMTICGSQNVNRPLNQLPSSLLSSVLLWLLPARLYFYLSLGADLRVAPCVDTGTLVSMRSSRVSNIVLASLAFPTCVSTSWVVSTVGTREREREISSLSQ